MGCIAFMAVGFALLRIGSMSVGLMLAMAPVGGTLMSTLISSDVVSPSEWIAASLVAAAVMYGVATRYASLLKGVASRIIFRSRRAPPLVSPSYAARDT